METEHNRPPFIPQDSQKLSHLKPIPNHNALESTTDEDSLNLPWIFAVFRRRAWIMLSVSTLLTGLLGGTVVWQSKQTISEYLGSFRLLVEPVTAEGRLSQQFLQSQIDARSDIQSVRIDNSLVDYETQIRVLKSPSLMNPVIEEIQSEYPGITYELMMKQLTIERLSYEKDGFEEGTKIIEVSYQSPDPEQIQFVLEQLAESYLNYSLEERQGSLIQGIKFIEAQLPQLQQQVSIFQQQLLNLQQTYNLIRPDQAEVSLSEQLHRVEIDRIETQAKLVEFRAIYENAKRQFDQGNATAVIARNPKAYERLLLELQQVEAELILQSSKLTNNSPIIQSLQEQRQNLENLLRQQSRGILETLESEFRGLVDREQVLLTEENLLRDRISQVPIFERKYDDLKQELEVARDSLTQFLSKREALSLDAAQQEIPWQVIAPPALLRNTKGELAPTGNQQTKRKLILVGIVSGLLGVGVGFLVEILLSVFHTPAEIEAATKLSRIGLIPFNRKLKRSLRLSQTQQLVGAKRGAKLQEDRETSVVTRFYSNRSDPNSPFWEAFRLLYTNIDLLSYDRPIRSLVISSAAFGDGKSTVAVHLAQIAAAMGRRVLLVDANFRHPKLHTDFNLSNQRGFSDAIASDLSLNEAIQQVPREDNLFILTAGKVPPDPIKLLSSKKRQYLMEQFNAFFDLVIYDTPPLSGLADSHILSAHVDGTILVVKIDRTDRTQLTDALDELKISGSSVLGFVVNCVKP
ncbi:MAG: polysaccharide biosynthesis tyrosine autokinase [Microcoleaceae cyanobacterium]